MIEISIIIPTLNESARIAALVDYLLRNGNGAVEVIVVDGRSPDGTARLAEEAGAKVIEVFPPSRACQMNAGAFVAKGNVLWFVHADTRPPGTFFSDVRDAVNAGYSMGGYRTAFDSGKFMLRFNAFFTRLNYVWFRGGDQTLFITRQAFDALQGFDESLEIMEEYELLLRSKSAGMKFSLIQKPVLISARKYDRNSWLRDQIVNFRAIRMFKKGRDTKEIKEFYYRSLR